MKDYGNMRSDEIIKELLKEAGLIPKNFLQAIWWRIIGK